MRRAALILLAAVTSCLTAGAAVSAADTSTGTLYQHLVVSWSQNNWRGHDRARFQIPGIGSGDVTCSPTTTWVQFFPSDTGAENDMWTVKRELKRGIWQTAVKDARVYTFSTPTSTIPHGTGHSAYEGFNQRTPIEASESGSLFGLISRRGARNTAGGAGATPTSIHLNWSWSGFHTAHARCRVKATFMTQIAGPSRTVSEGVRTALPTTVGPVESFNINWHGVDEAPAAAARPSSLTMPGIGTLSGTCGADGTADLTLTPQAGTTPFASVTTYQGEGIDNAVTDDYYTDPLSGNVGPITLPVNGEIRATFKPAWNAPASAEAQVLVSSIRITNDPNTANDFCEASVQAVGAPNPVL